MKHPLISVCCITYNHQDYIEDCIRGFLKQELTYNVEFLIHDDASTDQTQSLIKSLVGNDPRFKLILREKNIKSTGKAIFPLLFKEAQGKYIAMCEGDDYWTDPLKLQKQVDFLEENTNYAGVATNSKLVFESSGKSRLFKKTKSDLDLNINDFLKQRYFHTASFVSKKEFLKTIVFPKILSGDRFLFLFIASKGPIRYLNDTTCVYRKNEGGISKKVTSSHMVADLNFINASKQFLNKNQILILKKFIHKTIFEYSHKIKFNHYLYVGLKLLLITNFSRATIKLLLRNLNKVKFHD
jgi:glycosyltransferase involved in cell wall biosynthesis